MGDPPSRLIAILAGGRGRRMGGVDKAFLPFRGAPMIAHLIARLEPQAGTLVINSNADPAAFAAFGFPVLPDTIPDRPGPLAGVVAALDCAGSRGIEQVITVPVDLPFVPLGLVRHLADVLGSATIACAASRGRRHGIVALWPSTLAAALRRMVVDEGIRRVDDALARWPVAVAEFADAGPDPFLNLNRPEDLAAAERVAGGMDRLATRQSSADNLD
jgi:molybdopterin-guanine dinucleotide biosynthesis protein A